MEGVDLIDVAEDLDWWWTVGSTVNVYFHKMLPTLLRGTELVELCMAFVQETGIQGTHGNSSTRMAHCSQWQRYGWHCPDWFWKDFVCEYH